MDKKPLIGVSICAVVLLVLSSLSNVVGYQSVKSTAVNDSPLFSVRTQRATNQPSGNVLTSDYLGRGIKSNLRFSIRENGTGTLQQFIERIRVMDENEFGRFQSLVILSLYEDKSNKNIESIQVLSLLKQIRSQSIELPNNHLNNIGNKMSACTVGTAGHCYDTIQVVRCLIQWLIYYIVMALPSILLCFTLFGLVCH